MRLSAASLLVAFSMLPTLRDSGAKEPEKPVRQSVIEAPHDLESSWVRARGGFLPKPKTSVYQSTIPRQVRANFDRTFTDADVRSIMSGFDKEKVSSVSDTTEKAKLYASIANKFDVRYVGSEVVALFTNLQNPKITGDEKDPIKMAEKINGFCDLVNNDLKIKIPPYALIETFKILKEYDLFDSADSSSKVAEVMKYFHEKVVRSEKDDLPQLLTCFLSTYYIADIKDFKEKANVMGKFVNAFAPYHDHPEAFQVLLNGLAWDEHVNGIKEKSPEEIAKIVLEKVQKYKFSPLISVMLVRSGVDPDYANEYLEKAKAKIPYDTPIGQLILHKVPLEFYLNHRSHDPSVVVHEYNGERIKDLLKTSGMKDVDAAMEEINTMNKHLGFASPEHFVTSYQTIKSMENYGEKIPKIENIVLFLLPDHEPGHDSSTRHDSAFMFCKLPVGDLEKLGYTVILSTYNKDTDIKKIINEISGNYNCLPGVDWPVKAMVIAGHGHKDKLHINDVPTDPGFDSEKHSSFIFDTTDAHVFQGLEECFVSDSPVVIFCSCSTASPFAKPESLLTFASKNLPSNFLIQGPTEDTGIWGARQGPAFIFDGDRRIRGKKEPILK